MLDYDLFTEVLALAENPSQFIELSLLEFIIALIAFVVATIGSIYLAWYKINKRTWDYDLRFERMEMEMRAIRATMADYLITSAGYLEHLCNSHSAKVKHADIISAASNQFTRLSTQASSSARELTRSLYEKNLAAINEMLEKQLIRTQSIVELTEKGAAIVKELSCVQKSIDQKIQEIANEIKKEEEDCQRFGNQSSLMLLSRLIIMCDELLYAAKLTPKDLKKASKVLRKFNYEGDPISAINISFLIYIIRKSVTQDFLPREKLKLIDMAAAQYRKFIGGMEERR